LIDQSAARPVALEDGLQFFSSDQAILVDAISDRLIPGDANCPGARQARTVIYIDRALAGYFSGLQVLYREGLEMIARLSNELFGRGFAALPEPRQDEILRIAEDARHAKGSEQLALFFAVIREHTLEGMFGDPIYGGNHNAVGWKMIGFPGAQWGYSAEQMAPGYDATQIPVATLSRVQRRRADKPTS
jgi:gluconate 2-dehydrogenase gamma chain